MSHRQPERERVVAGTVPRRERFRLEPVEKRDRRIRAVIGVESRVRRDGAALVLDDPVERIPRRERRHLSRIETKLAFEKLQHGRVRVPPFVVAVDHIVVRFADQDFGIAAIREPVPVRHAYRAPARAVSGNRAVLRHQRAPEERHQPLAARLRRGGPVALVRARRLDFCVAWDRRSQYVEVEPAEDLLRTDAVERDQDDVAGSGGGEGRRPISRRTVCSGRGRELVPWCEGGTAAGKNQERDESRRYRSASKAVSVV